MEVKKDGSFPFLNTLLRRRNDGSLYATIYRKPTHTDRYLDFHFHHSSHVKRELVRCLFDRAKNTTTRQDSLQPEHHLARVLKQNEYPNIFIQSSSKPTRMDVEATRAPPLEEWHRLTLVMHPYTERVSETGVESIWHKGRLQIRSMLTKLKDL